MNKVLAKQLLEFVNHKQNMDDLKAYVEAEINEYKKYLVSAETLEEVRKYQGAIRALEKLNTLKEEVHQAAK